MLIRKIFFLKRQCIFTDSPLGTGRGPSFESEKGNTYKCLKTPHKWILVLTISDGSSFHQKYIRIDIIQVFSVQQNVL